MPFEMPSPGELATMTPEELFNLEVEAEKAKHEMEEYVLAVETEKRELARRQLDLTDKIAKGNHVARGLRQQAKALRQMAFNRKSGY